MAKAANPGSALLTQIAKNKITLFQTKEEVLVESLWQDNDVVMAFLRRFGCQLCRLGAVELATIESTLRKNGVKIAAVGLEELGAEEFIDKEFFPRSVYVYIDKEKKCYQGLGFKRFTLSNVVKALVSSTTRKSLAKARERKITGNMSGDGFQNGGLLVIKKGGELVFFHKEEFPGEYADNDAILQALGITDVKIELYEEKKEEIKQMEEEALNCDKVCNYGSEPPPPEPKSKNFVIKKKQ